MTLRALLRGIIGVDPDILGGEIRGEESHRILAAPKLHTNIADRLRKTAMRLPPVERAGGFLAAYLLSAHEKPDGGMVAGPGATFPGRREGAPRPIGARPLG